MKTIPLLVAALLVAALLVAALLVAGNWVFAEEEPDLDDPKVREKILQAALLEESFEHRGPDREQLVYQAGKETPYTGWVKGVHGNGQVSALVPFKDGKEDGLWTQWHDNGEKKQEGHYKDGEQDGLYTEWHDNGQKMKEGHFKDGEMDGL